LTGVGTETSAAVHVKLDTPVSSRDRLLFALKTKGPMTASQLARRLRITSMAAHQQLSSLKEDGLVAFTKEQGKVGRPAHLWALTSKAHDRFPDSHADLAIAMLRAIRACFGDKGLAKVTEERTRRQIRDYRRRMPGPSAPIERRLKALTQLRRAEGFMAEWARACDGTIELLQNHCSIRKAADICWRLCDTELVLLRSVLGKDVTVQRVEHTLQGDSRCAYQVREVKRAAGRGSS